jgi:hypothetical protein
MVKSVYEICPSLTNELRKLDRTDSEILEEFIKKYATILPDTHQVSVS